VKELTKCSLHFRQDLSRADFLVYWESLKDRDADAVRRAVVLCRETLEFMPKLRDVLDRLSPAAQTKKPDLKVVKEWDEEYGDRKLHFTEYEGGYRQTRWVRP
jgi:hypothetical protein